ncbi:MAG: pirin family protein [Candidatus Hydrothermarchaeota archaeon]
MRRLHEDGGVATAIRIIGAGERFHLERDWLSTYWLFSFDQYYDPENVSFGPLRVFNDDIVQPGHGFPLHPHQEMEIVTIVLGGELTHEDSAGGGGVIGPGDVQRMTAGTGILHSEFNHGAVPVHLFQIWITPEVAGLDPSYEQRTFAWRKHPGRLLPLVSGHEITSTITLHQGATISASNLSAGEGIEYSPQGRRVFVYLSEGELTLGRERLGPGDQARVEGEARLSFRALEPSEFVLIDLP